MIHILQLCAGIAIITVSIMRKSLYSDRRQLYNALTVFDKVLFKRLIVTDIYRLGNVERLDKSSIWEISFTPRLLREYNGFAIHLQDENRTTKVRLIKISDEKKLNKAIEFIQRNSPIRFPKTHYEKHW